MDTKRLQKKLAQFASERDWDQFHNPKNLAIALSVECSELLEEFQWLTDSQASSVMESPEQAERIREEMADIASYLLQLASKLGIDLEAALLKKIDTNAAKYPVDKFKGSAKKYNR
ncbi:nucleotide pyrophosphohydrolase [Pseudomonas sp. AN3A02]|jgi:NTP pyrophosphatase (non-canonical NTP hydrolase)|uniref:nucleotide pyrophosphohydrolase n=1 Tax=Pseudomonas sp. AN3A02 TaxID=2719587 RepID=UPI00142FCF40|nr:nucleotide pyrophosphohydrolase [Pseudomonas sp. AN3A02]NIL20047.1 nucleotide pyrophosphohydrolase [Pseudomonas sp. AN3A02]